MAAFAWSLAAASSPVAAAPAVARTSINIPAGPLDRSLRRLSDATGVSVGFAGRIPAIRTRDVRGASSPAEALRAMLAGTGLRAVSTGPGSFRIEWAPIAQPQARVPPGPLPADGDSVPEILVTALKRARPLSGLPATIHVIPGDTIRTPTGVAGTDMIAKEWPSLTVSSLGPGRNRLFLRGIGDGPLNGFNQGSVAILLDEARLNYDAPDPDWALVDVDQIEVLEGPQGPLYGTGALGGIVRISTNRPDFSGASARLAAGLASTRDGDFSNSQSAMVNLPLLGDRLALRAVAYRQDQAGWINNQGGATDSNSEKLAGGRLALRWHPADRWTVDLAAAVQERSARDSQYVDGGLGPVDRPDRGLEPRDLDNRLAILTINGRIGGLDLTSVTGVSRQEAMADYDATPLASLLGTVGLTMVRDDRRYRLFDQEIRLSNAASGGVEWLVGASFIKASTNADIMARDSGSAVPVLAFRRAIVETAAFGEVSLPVATHWTVSGGARVFSSKLDDKGVQGETGRIRSKSNVRGSGSASVSWTPSAATSFFLRAATAYRPGGINVEPDATQAVHDADELASIELGSRVRVGPGLSADATLFAARWRRVQADELLANGLVATRNAGDARNFGLEAALRWSPLPSSQLSASLLVQSAKLDSPDETADIEDKRLPAVPQFAGRLKFSQDFHVGGWSGKASIGLQFSGATHLSFDPVADRRTPGHAALDASMALNRGAWTITLAGDNLTNSSADTFGFGNPYRVRAVPQRTPARPITIGINVTRDF